MLSRIKLQYSLSFCYLFCWDTGLPSTLFSPTLQHLLHNQVTHEVLGLDQISLPALFLLFLRFLLSASVVSSSASLVVSSFTISSIRFIRSPFMSEFTPLHPNVDPSNVRKKFSYHLVIYISNTYILHSCLV